MKYKEFNDWCNKRACDGHWGMNVAIFCTDIIKQIESCLFWNKERKWKELNAKYQIEDNIINPINHKISEIYGNSLQK